MASEDGNLTAVVIGDVKDLGCRSALVTDSEGTRGLEDLKAIQKANYLQEAAIDGPGENSLYDRL